MLKRIPSTGVNLMVRGVPVGIFLVAFLALNALGTAQKPPTISLLSAIRDLNIGDVITANEPAVKTVFQDDNTSLYIPGEEATGLVGGMAGQPIVNGQPIFHSALVAQGVDHQFDPWLVQFQFPSEKSGHFCEQAYVIGSKVAANGFLSLRSKRAGCNGRSKSPSLLPVACSLVRLKLGCSGFQMHFSPLVYLTSLEHSPKNEVFLVLQSRRALLFQFPIFGVVFFRLFEHFSPCSESYYLAGEGVIWLLFSH